MLPGEYHELVVSPMPGVMIGHKTAGCVFDAMYANGIQGFLQTWIGEMQQCAEWSLSLRELDAIYSNTKVDLYYMRKLPAKVLHMLVHCGLHQNNLGSGDS